MENSFKYIWVQITYNSKVNRCLPQSRFIYADIYIIKQYYGVPKQLKKLSYVKNVEKVQKSAINLWK